MLGHFSRPAALLAACALAVAAPAARAEPPKQQLVRRVYQVADLVVPRPDVVVVADRDAAKAEDAPKAQPTREDKLIRLIEQTIQPQSWSGSGGAGTLDYFPMTASLVVNQTPDVQEQVADILTALRRLQDTEVALEVRILTLPQETIERVGIDFNPQAGGQATLARPVRTMTCPASMMLPRDGGLKATFLSDRQTCQLLEAAAADPQTSIRQTPRLTLLNGQCGNLHIQEATDQGLHMAVRPVVSADRQFVKVSLTIEDTEPAPVTALAGPVARGAATSPAVDVLSVAAAAVIPDGGTVVLGGFPKMCEVQKECAPPVVNNIPYLNRLFTNVRPVREAQRVYVLVTPRVVAAQEKEQAKPAACRPAGMCPQPRTTCTAPAPSPAPTAAATECIRAVCVPQVDIATQTKDVLVEVLKAYDRACAEGDAESAKKLARAALELDPTCFGKKR
jgi:type II secretory pathway component GspD/PulD (secretin)